MGIVGRFSRLVRANLNYLVNGAEDPEKTMQQALAQMQADLLSLRQSVAQAIACQKRTERQLAQTQARSQEWYNRAQLAVQKNDDATAREALTRYQAYREPAQSLHRQIEPQQQVICQLKLNLAELERKLADARAQKDLFIARARAAQSSLKLNELQQTAGNFSAFDAMADHVLELESQASLSQDSLEQTFSKLERQTSVERHLAALKESSNK